MSFGKVSPSPPNPVKLQVLLNQPRLPPTIVPAPFYLLFKHGRARLHWARAGYHFSRGSCASRDFSDTEIASPCISRYASHAYSVQCRFTLRATLHFIHPHVVRYVSSNYLKLSLKSFLLLSSPHRLVTDASALGLQKGSSPAESSL